MHTMLSECANPRWAVACKNCFEPKRKKEIRVEVIFERSCNGDLVLGADGITFKNTNKDRSILPLCSRSNRETLKLERVQQTWLRADWNLRSGRQWCRGVYMTSNPDGLHAKVLGETVDVITERPLQTRRNHRKWRSNNDVCSLGKVRSLSLGHDDWQNSRSSY